jgi:hypothetical protein
LGKANRLNERNTGCFSFLRVLHSSYSLRLQLPLHNNTTSAGSAARDHYINEDVPNPHPLKAHFRLDKHLYDPLQPAPPLNFCSLDAEDEVRQFVERLGPHYVDVRVERVALGSNSQSDVHLADCLMSNYSQIALFLLVPILADVDDVEVGLVEYAPILQP